MHRRHHRDLRGYGVDPGKFQDGKSRIVRIWRDAACAYLERTVGNISPILQAFLDHGDRAIGYLEDQTAVRFKPVLHYPDYYPDLLGATLGGRVLEPVPFDGRLLGRHFALLHPPLPEFTLFGGMMLDRADIPHFRKAARSLRSAVRVAGLLARHTWQRLAHPRGVSLVLGNALAARLLQSLLQFGVSIRTDTEVSALWFQGRSVGGVTVKTPQGMCAIQARRESCLRQVASLTTRSCGSATCQQR